MIEIVPSILAADFAHLADEVRRVESRGAKMLHVDVMDGHFVPNLAVGTPVVQSLRKVTKATLDVHLMIDDPDTYAPIFIDAGANCVSVHYEVCRHLDRTIRLIQSKGAKAGVVINPATRVDLLEPVLPVLDYVLVMSVNPGFGGQQFLPYVLEKAQWLDRQRDERGLNFQIEIDGGITLQNAADAVRAGVNWLVAGSSIFHTPDAGETFAQMQRMAENAMSVRV